MSGEINKSETNKAEKSFGLLFAIVFFVIFVYLYLLHDLHSFQYLGISFLLVWVSLYVPGFLKYPNLIWVNIGIYLGKVMNPIILLLIYLIAVLPTSVVVRLISKGGFRKYKSAEFDSYWVKRGPERSSFDQQF